MATNQTATSEETRRSITPTMTVEAALAIQARQIEAYSVRHPGVAEIVAKATTAHALKAGVEYEVAIINRHIPRGGAIEDLLGVDFGG